MWSADSRQKLALAFLAVAAAWAVASTANVPRLNARATVICHAYNEAYLMPWWLEHHRRIFDHGIVIDYDSTDGTPDIVRRMCPGWEVRRSRNREFDAVAVDEEVMEVERSVEGIKVALNVTEFLLPHRPLHELFHPTHPQCFHMDAVIPLRSSCDKEHRPASLREMLLGFDRVADHSKTPRFIHTFPDGAYRPGRHSSARPSAPIPERTRLLWFGFYPWNAHMVRRMVQIGPRIPQADVDRGLGVQHRNDVAKREQEQREFIEASAPAEEGLLAAVRAFA